MPVCTKTFVQYGCETANVYTVMLKKSNMMQHSLVLARMALDVIGNNKMDKQSEGVCRLSQALREAVNSKIEARQDYISLPESIDVSCKVLKLDGDTTVMYGTAVCCVGNKKMDTGIQAVHASMTFDGVRVAVTSVLSNNVQHTRNTLHFVCCGDNKCVNVRAIALNCHCESRVVWQPMLSHFLRRVNCNAMHTQSFRNLGLKLQHTKNTITPLYDVVESSSGEYNCFSVFI
jgi:hypothetical protein